MDITVDLASPTPPYDHIRAQIAAAIDRRQLDRGTRLPRIGALAADLGVAAGTVARAYRELEGAGLVTSRRRLGTVVTAPSVRWPRPATSVRQPPNSTTRSTEPG